MKYYRDGKYFLFDTTAQSGKSLPRPQRHVAFARAIKASLDQEEFLIQNKLKEVLTQNTAKRHPLEQTSVRWIKESCLVNEECLVPAT